MLDVRRMRMLEAVVTLGSVTAAAAELGYTPSAVSQQIGALERETGTDLLERVGRHVRPTAAGRLLTEHSAAIGRRIAEAETALADLKAGRTGRLSVRYFATAGAGMVAPAVAAFRRRHPGVRVDLALSDPEDPLGAVRRGEADIALVVPLREERPADDLLVEQLADDPYRVVLPKDHPLAAKRVVDLALLAGEPWVGNEWPAGPCLGRVIDACAEAGFAPDFVVQSEDHATALGFVAAGLGVALMPVLGIGGGHPGVVVRRVRGPQPVRSIRAVRRRTQKESPVLREMLAALREAARG
ncbi:LysR family transcriptional regulator [Streptomyces sp. t39]|uniref:LysR family transcriptional regulator n=1 Tax=Streptomyces sp. t39 TaxID=1828156 RepID=UPI0011CD3CE7|nr:LysR family transcriptional regulator [Streptomyces sp. t39]TXS44782.1 LysR family transcriptional regulator [Streptomyces sp. t39]